MPPTTQQFKWKDRDTAAQDILAIVHHAPPYLSELAARLLQAFRSDAILSDLRDLVLDASRPQWQRIQALRAFTAVRGDILALEFRPLAQAAIARRQKWAKGSDRRQQELYALTPDFMDDLAHFVDDHASNREWFFDLIDSANPGVRKKFLQDQLMFDRSDHFRKLVTDRLTGLVDEHSELLDLGVMARLLGATHTGDLWLDKHFDRALEWCLAKPGNGDARHLARFWDRLKSSLLEKSEFWRVVLAEERGRAPRDDPDRYRASSAFQYLDSLYQQAKQGDDRAYGKLARLAERWRGNIPMRAVASHFVGQLQGVFNVFPALARLMRYGDVDWGDERFEAPIRYEAGEALIRLRTAAAWEGLVDSYFIHPRNDLMGFQIDWIDYLTDVLSGESDEYRGMHYGEVAQRSWFRALSEVTDEELARMMT